jgi:mono/diheme cytochrome c family protein
MFKKVLGFSSISLLLSLLVACGSDEGVKKVEVQKATAIKAEIANVTPTGKKTEGRWYTNAQLIRGKKVFKANCAVCHGDNGQGLVKDWKKADANGEFPAPPINGSAHAWHHSKELLLRTINNGGIPLGGTMPAFKDTLSEKEKIAVLAHVMNLWPDKIYRDWAQRNLGSK